MDPTKYYLSDLKALLKFGGLWFEKEEGLLGRYIPYIQAARIPVILVIELIVIYGAVQAGLTFFLNPSSAYLTLGFVVIAMFLPFAFNYRLLVELISTLEKSHAEMNEEWKHAIIQEEYANSWRLATFYKLYTLGFTLLFPAVGLLTDTVHIYQGKEIYRFPQCLDIYDGAVRDLYHYTIVIVSAIWTNLISTQNIAVIGQMFVFTGFIKAEILILMGSIERLSNEGHKKKHWEMKEIIKTHQKIIRIHSMFTGLLGFSFAAQSIVGGINSCLIGVCLFVQYNQGGVILFSLVLSYAINFQALLLLCGLNGETLQQQRKMPVYYTWARAIAIVNIGETLYFILTVELRRMNVYSIPTIPTVKPLYFEVLDQNDELHFTLYNCPWYEQSREVKRTILMMLRQTQKPFALDYKKNVPLNLKTYSQIMSTAYSYFNVYLKSQM